MKIAIDLNDVLRAYTAQFASYYKRVISGVLTCTSLFCARWRRAWSINTRASMASAIGAARKPTQGSWRPCVAISTGLP